MSIFLRKASNLSTKCFQAVLKLKEKKNHLIYETQTLLLSQDRIAHFQGDVFNHRIFQTSLQLLVYFHAQVHCHLGLVVHVGQQLMRVRVRFVRIVVQGRHDALFARHSVFDFVMCFARVSTDVFAQRVRLYDPMKRKAFRKYKEALWKFEPLRGAFTWSFFSNRQSTDSRGLARNRFSRLAWPMFSAI